MELIKLKVTADGEKMHKLIGVSKENPYRHEVRRVIGCVSLIDSCVKILDDHDGVFVVECPEYHLSLVTRMLQPWSTYQVMHSAPIDA